MVSQYNFDSDIQRFKEHLKLLLEQHNLHPTAVWLVGGIMYEHDFPILFKYLKRNPNHKDIDIVLIFPGFPENIRELTKRNQFFYDLFHGDILKSSFDGLPIHFLPATDVNPSKGMMQLW
jgi:hypothetical protein